LAIAIIFITPVGSSLYSLVNYRAILTKDERKLVAQAKGIISSVLSPACRVWLRSQVSQVEELQVNIAGGDRQILGGTIPQVSVTAIGAIYQGLSLGSIDLLATNIRVNLPQVMRGKPLRLLEPINVEASAKFTEADLQASLAAPLLAGGITDLLAQILNTDPQQLVGKITWERLSIAPDRLSLQGMITTPGVIVPIEIHTAIAVIDGHKLHLDPLEIICPIELFGSDVTSYVIDLGRDVNLTELTLDRAQLLCQGKIQVQP
jgi:LmeA-like phospholipid-binding